LTRAGEAVSNVTSATDGTVAFVAGHDPSRRMRVMSVDRHGTPTRAITSEPLEYPRFPRISPDGRRLALTAGPGGFGQLWIFDLDGRNQPVKLTFQNHNLFPVWSPDGSRIAFLRRSQSQNQMLSIAADGSAVDPTPIFDGGFGPVLAWSPDGQMLLFAQPQPPPEKIMVFSFVDHTTRRWAPGSFAEFGGSLSPDGHWVAYSSNATGAFEVWVRPFPGPGVPVRISSDGGTKPLWSRDGRELFFESGDRFLSARVTSMTPEFRVDRPELLFAGGFMRDDDDPNIRFIDAAPDGHLAIVEAEAERVPGSIVVAQHWRDELRRLLPN
jgi:Tol biopolymer transport system component